MSGDRPKGRRGSRSFVPAAPILPVPFGTVRPARVSVLRRQATQALAALSADDDRYVIVRDGCALAMADRSRPAYTGFPLPAPWNAPSPNGGAYFPKAEAEALAASLDPPGFAMPLRRALKQYVGLE